MFLSRWSKKYKINIILVECAKKKSIMKMVAMQTTYLLLGDAGLWSSLDIAWIENIQ